MSVVTTSKYRVRLIGGAVLLASLAAPVVAADRDEERSAAVTAAPGPEAFVAEQSLVFTRHAEIRELLGERRYKELRDALTTYEVENRVALPAPILDQRDREELRGAARSSILKVCREYAEQRVLDSVVDRLVTRYRTSRDAARDQAAGGIRASFSPRVSLGSNASLGVKMRLRGDVSPLLSNSAFYVKQYLTRDETVLGFGYDDGRVAVSLEQALGDEVLGDATYALVKITF